MIRFGAHEPLPATWAAVAAEDAAAWAAIWAASRCNVQRARPLPPAEWLALEAAREAQMQAWLLADAPARQGELF